MRSRACCFGETLLFSIRVVVHDLGGIRVPEIAVRRDQWMVTAQVGIAQDLLVHGYLPVFTVGLIELPHLQGNLTTTTLQLLLDKLLTLGDNLGRRWCRCVGLGLCRSLRTCRVQGWLCDRWLLGRYGSLAPLALSGNTLQPLADRRNLGLLLGRQPPDGLTRRRLSRGCCEDRRWWAAGRDRL